LGALNALDTISLQQRMQYLWPLLEDPVMAVRLTATRLLAGVALPDQGEVLLDPKRKHLLDKAVAEYITAMQESADMPTGQMQLGLMYLARKQFDQAENAYHHALLVEPDFVPALVNLADLYRLQGRDQQAKPLLEKALGIDGQNADSQYAMGLLYIRLGQTTAAVEHLAAAAAAAPQVALYGYVYAVSLFETGKQEWAITTLKQSLRRHPGDRNILSALVAYLNKLGRLEEANRYAAQL
jgi:tetratricopeptide (TPR) repeat protein